MSPRTPSLSHALLTGAAALALACSLPDETVPYALSSVTPDRGSVAGGTRVVLAGVGFVEGATVTFGGVEATDVVVIPATASYPLDQITCSSPAHAGGVVDVTVRNPDWTTMTRPAVYLFYDVPPRVLAEHDRVVTLGARVSLDATLTVDPENASLSYAWTLLEKPKDSAATLADPGTATSSFVVDLAGTYRASLSVGDGASTSGPVSVLVTTSETGSIVPDGGPDACYGASGRVHCPSVGEEGYGQDGHYLLRPADLSAVGDTVEDRVTSLTWQRASPGRFTWYEASGTPHAEYNPASTDVCGNLVLGGHDDWRLPSVRELATLLRHGSGAHVDLVAFPAGAGVSWSASQDSSDLFDPPYAVDFAAGALTRGAGNRSTPLEVRCVRGPAWGAGALVDQGDGTVLDGGTGLEWQASPPSDARTWTEALAYCEGLSLGAVQHLVPGGVLHDDWRLPSISEAMTIVFPLGCAGAFPASQAAHYWSSTAEGASAFALDCTRAGFTDTQLETTAHLARCVR